MKLLKAPRQCLLPYELLKQVHSTLDAEIIEDTRKGERGGLDVREGGKLFEVLVGDCIDLCI